MIGSQLRKTDLSLLYALIALVEERSVTMAATRMNLSQPAMSRTFARMKDLFKDDLLIRTSGGYEPTQRALRLYSDINDLLPRIEGLVRDDRFEPFTARTTFRVAASDYAASILLRDFMARLEAEAPNVSLEIHALSPGQFDQLDSGALDLVLWGNIVPKHQKAQVIFTDRFVCAVRTDHPVSADALTMDQYLAYPHAVIALKDHQQGLVDQSLHDKRLSRRVQLELPYFACASWGIEATDAILTLPRMLAEKLSGFSGIRLVDPPLEFPEIEYVQVWHPRVDNDPAHIWFRDLFADVSRQVVLLNEPE